MTATDCRQHQSAVPRASERGRGPNRQERALNSGESARRYQLTATVVSTTSRQVTIGVDGEIDIASSDLITGLVTAQLAAGRSDVCLDLAGVSFADCSALEAIAQAHRQCRAAGGRLTLTNLTPVLVKLIRITRLDRTLDIRAESGLALDDAKGNRQ